MQVMSGEQMCISMKKVIHIQNFALHVEGNETFTGLNGSVY
jgi:hypothetical protein